MARGDGRGAWRPLSVWDRIWLRLMFRLHRESLGRRGERAAARFLRRQSLRLVARSWRHPLGEIDLIAVDGRTVVFVEVKTRQSDQAGEPIEAVDRAKQARLTRLALAFLRSRELLEARARFDVLALTWGADDELPHIDYFPDAFEPLGEFQFFS